MRQDDYTYAVARIRFRETKLLSDADIAALLSAKDVENVMRLLRDKAVQAREILRRAGITVRAVYEKTEAGWREAAL